VEESRDTYLEVLWEDISSSETALVANLSRLPPGLQHKRSRLNIHLQCIAPAVFGVRIRTVASPVDFANSSTFPKLRGSWNHIPVASVIVHTKSSSTFCRQSKKVDI